MDRDDALKLLKGGPVGIAEWNRRRDAGEEIPDLNRCRPPQGRTPRGHPQRGQPTLGRPREG